MDDDGCFYDHVPGGFAGKHVYKVNDEIADALAAADRLLARGKLVHSYPHSWRSKAPLIFRNTLQWFISMETTGLRATALDAIDQVRWVPPSWPRTHSLDDRDPAGLGAFAPARLGRADRGLRLARGRHTAARPRRGRAHRRRRRGRRGGRLVHQ